MNMQKINRFWQSANLFLAPVLLVILIYYKNSMPFYQFLLWLHLPFLMFHECEEYVLSPVSFKEFFNLKTPFGSQTNPNYPLDEGYVFQVNIVIAWPVIIIGALLANIAPWVGFSMMIFELTINNLMHTIIFQPKKPAYNPGLITNSLLLLPLGTVTFLVALDFFQWYDWVFSVMAGAAVVGLLAYKTTSRQKRANKEGVKTTL
ncbi:MAG: HXXEE domain-containing protein [Bacteroidetes bacterium]|nr:HXXEE domain-containing protein [Bacteroidota bacterium]